MRTLRIVLVATAIGATAGAAVVVSLVVRPASGTADSSIAAHALVSAVPAVNSASAAVVPAKVTPAQAALPPAAASPQQTGASGERSGAGGKPNKAEPPQQIANAPNAANGAAPAHTAHIEEPAAAPAREESALLPEAAPGKKTATKKHRVAGYETMRRWQSKKPQRSGGFEPLFRLFSSRGGSVFSAN
jgi:hypothetical protein